MMAENQPVNYSLQSYTVRHKVGKSNDDIYHEGWTHHRNLADESKIWRIHWLALKKQKLILLASFTNQNVVETWNLNESIEIINLDGADTIQTGFGLQLTSSSTLSGNPVHYLQFKTENDRDLWKAYIIGFSSGVVPSMVSLLPGQIKDVHDAVRKSKESSDPDSLPPPLPPVHFKRPSLKSLMPEINLEKSFPSQPASDKQFEYDEAFHMQNFCNDMSEMKIEKDTYEDVLSKGPVGSLSHRQSELAFKALDKEVKLPGYPPAPCLVSLQTTAPVNFSRPLVCDHPQNISKTCRVRERPRVHRLNDAHTSSMANGNRTQRISSWNPSAMSFKNNNMVHPFYSDLPRNIITPSWFIDCNRDKAELILTVARSHGNVLLRPSSTFSQTGQYVISMRREVVGGTELHHYSVIRTRNGFLIDTETKHDEFMFLSDLMEYFVNSVGRKYARLMSQFDLNKIILDIAPTAASPVTVSDSNININNTTVSDWINPSLNASTSCLFTTKTNVDSPQTTVVGIGSTTSSTVRHASIIQPTTEENIDPDLTL